VTLKLDENLPSWLAPLLRDLGHDADTVIDEGLTGKDDATVWAAAQHAGRFFVTLDLDFTDTRRYAPGTHHGVLVLRLGDNAIHRLHERLLAIFATEAVDTWTGCVVVATERKVRVQRTRAA